MRNIIDFVDWLVSSRATSAGTVYEKLILVFLKI